MCIRDSLGVTLGLFDYLADLFGFDDSALGRFKTALLTFIPVSYTHLIAEIRRHRGLYGYRRDHQTSQPNPRAA